MNRSPREYNQAARAALKKNQNVEALALLEKSLKINPDNVETLCLGALAYWRGSANFEAAEALLQRARRLRADEVKVLTLSGELHLHMGLGSLAISFAEQAIAIDDRHSPAYVLLARANAATVDDDAFDKMLALVKVEEIGAQRRRYLHNSIGRVFDARGEYDAAFKHFSRANELANSSYNPTQREQRLRQARELFTRDYFDKYQNIGVEKSGCVFIIGLPRSGSTLLEQILCAHPDTASCQESDAVSDINRSLYRGVEAKNGKGSEDFFAHLRSINKFQVELAARAYLAATSRQMIEVSPRRRIDKRLGNFLHFPLIKLMFPDSFFLHTNRHPLDVCLSCFTQAFDQHHYANDLGDLAHYYLTYHAYMRHWHNLFPEAIRHCRYETLVEKSEHEIRHILNKLGLEWHSACSAPHRNDRLVSTASAAEVREPMHRRRVHRWRNYEKHLQPLIVGLGEFTTIQRLFDEFYRP